MAFLTSCICWGGGESFCSGICGFSGRITGLVAGGLGVAVTTGVHCTPGGVSVGRKSNELSDLQLEVLLGVAGLSSRSELQNLWCL